MPRKFDFLSPGIEITEVDQSILPAQVDADGPVIIGRFRKGPGMKPAKVRSLEYFVQVYGNPIPGGSSEKGDVWRDGPQLSAPTYGAYAAQAWLASRTSPVNLVRLLGDEHPSATGPTGKAGWQLSSSVPSATKADNSTAYGLFVADQASKATAITISNPGPFNAQNLANDNTHLSLHRMSDATGSAPDSAPHLTFANFANGDGTLAIEIDFSEGAVGTSGTVTRNATGAGNSDTPLLTIFINTGDTLSFETVLGFVNSALETEINRPDAVLKEVSLDYTANGDSSTLLIYNLDDATDLGITDITGTQPQFAAAGTNDAGGSVGASNLANNIIQYAQKATQQSLEGSLAAIFYCDSGYLTLTDGSTPKACTAYASTADNIGFKLQAFDTSGTSIETIDFNFDKNSTNYIRNRFNTNPQKVNSGCTDPADLKTYWLGESFERSLKTKVTGSSSGQQVGVLLPLHKNNVADKTGNWSCHRTGSLEAKSGWIVDYWRKSSGDYNPQKLTKLFRFESLHAGEEIQKEILVTIEDLKLPTNATIYPYGTFTVKIINVNGGVLEKYSGCNLDPNSPNFVARRIGDMFMTWDNTDRRYRSFGNFANVSDYVRIKMYDEDGDYRNSLPAGFYGPGRPKGFAALAGDVNPKDLNGGDLPTAWVKGSNTVPEGAGAGELVSMTGLSLTDLKFSFPSIPLRVNGSDGFSSNPYKVYFGIRPKISTNSTTHDEDYVDYVRSLPSTYTSQLHNVTDAGFEYSFIFSLDDIVIDAAANTVTYTSGSHVLGNSYSATSGFSALLSKDVKQFVVPLFGGFDGLNIKEKEPFNFDDVNSSTSETTNYLVYSLNKALDSVSDPEVVPASLLSIPGIKNTHITDKVIRTAEARKDMLAVIDLVGDYTPSYESMNDQSQRLGSVTDTISNIKNRSINSSYAAAYYPAVQIQDNLNNGERIWVPSSVAGIGAMAQSDAASELWFAPAGFNRGGLGALGGRSGPRVLQARQRLDVSERDKLYEVNINPIATFPNEGVVIFGQKTLQQTPSALDRINVRRLMIFLKAEIGKVAKTILFDNNVRSTWARFKAQAEPILSDVKSKFGLTEYRLVLDSSTTTPDLIDRNILYAKVFLKPARAIEYIAIDFVITRTGAEFA